MDYKTKESQRKASAKYQSEKRCKLTIDITPAQRDQINEYCKQFGGTATHIKRLLRNDMRKNGIVPIETVNNIQAQETETDQTEE